MAGRMVPFDHPFFGRQMSRSMWDDPWSWDLPSPSRVFDQNFGVALPDEDLFPPQSFRGWYVRPRRQQSIPQQTGMSEVAVDANQFKVNLDVAQFKPEELEVKALGNKVTVHAKHEERPDEHGFIMREFKRTYVLPKDVDANEVKSSVSADGVLTLHAPKRALTQTGERSIPIEHVAALSVTDKTA